MRTITVNAPYKTLNVVVPDAWIDVNGHMNATHYGLVAYDAHYNLSQEIGIGDAYVQHHNCGKVVLESHIVYEREVFGGDELEVVSWLLAVDAKRLHFFHELYNLTRGFRAATAEQIDMHVDLALRKSSPMPAALYQRLQARVRDNLAAGVPRGVGSLIRPPLNNWLND